MPVSTLALASARFVPLAFAVAAICTVAPRLLSNTAVALVTAVAVWWIADSIRAVASASVPVALASAPMLILPLFWMFANASVKPLALWTRASLAVAVAVAAPA